MQTVKSNSCDQGRKLVSGQFISTALAITFLITGASLTEAQEQKPYGLNGQVFERVVYSSEAQPTASAEPLHADWSAAQATGAPDTFRYGDEVTAWASRTPDSQDEWLRLTYEPAVEQPVMILIFETYNPGAVIEVNAAPPAKQFKAVRGGSTIIAVPAYPITDVDSEEGRIWSGDSQELPRGINVKSIPLQTSYPIETLKLTLASKRVNGWNEIDAVGILDAQGNVHWATKADASSSYAERESRSTPIVTVHSRREEPDSIIRLEIQELTETVEQLRKEIQELKTQQEK
ncbi:MAG: hypothetical protein KDA65_02415 [Planctomycetaceae bacterium]|nr:hypothetical protein [Planctomycetaceae bacterium]